MRVRASQTAIAADSWARCASNCSDVLSTSPRLPTAFRSDQAALALSEQGIRTDIDQIGHGNLKLLRQEKQRLKGGVPDAALELANKPWRQHRREIDLRLALRPAGASNVRSDTADKGREIHAA